MTDRRLVCILVCASLTAVAAAALIVLGRLCVPGAEELWGE